MLIDIIKVLQDYDHYNGGEMIEIAKGKHEFITAWCDIKEKIRRTWLSKKK